jgi:hypothetical protein
MGRIILGLPLLAIFAFLAEPQQSVPVDSGGITGFVRQPDGTPVPGATVSATAACKGENSPPDQQVTAAADGSFLILPFANSSCNRMQLSAGKEDELWRTTGDGVFDKDPNGTTPIVTASRKGAPTRADIMLGARAGALSLRVKDTATDQFIWSQLHIVRMKVPGANLGTADTETDKDGTVNTLLLPAGQYEISLQGFECKDVRYTPISPPKEAVTIESGQRVSKDIAVNLRTLRPDLSAGHQKPCKL